MTDLTPAAVRLIEDLSSRLFPHDLEGLPGRLRAIQDDAVTGDRLARRGGDGAERIAVERQRQINEEGYTAEHDRGYADELFAAAACYAISARYTIMTTGGILDEPPELWPWDRRYWKPTGDPVRDGEKAGALAAAGIDARIAGRGQP